MSARQVHVTVDSREIGKFMDVDRSGHICFRCGEQGHVRYQCLLYKVRLCIPNEEGKCIQENCSFAHGKEELRTPWKPKCVRVVKQAGKLICIGCNSGEHTFKKCPLTQSLIIC